ncbi:MAG: hypothetical protein RR620_13055 [Clostridium sp.]
MDFNLLFELLIVFVTWSFWAVVYGCVTIIAIFFIVNLLKFIAPGAYRFLVREFNEIRGY